MTKHGRWYFELRAFATFIDYAIYGAAYSAYVYAFGKPNDEGGRSGSGCATCASSR